MRAGIQFSVLGPVRLLRQGVEEVAGQPRQCAVLASLLLRAGRPVSLSTLVDDVWGMRLLRRLWVRYVRTSIGCGSLWVG
ncbi:Transcriptional regulatory protein MoaR1 [Streptomyces sp. MBT84]|nr:Transcriptional regulatory protein MoaR1 [Streptomyces sp. MBT84]